MSDLTYTLGIDLGVSSIGWALVEKTNDKPSAVKDIGVRIIPLSTDDEKEFIQGNAISKNQRRTTARTQRKGLDRYQLRRKALTNVLGQLGMMPDRRLLLELSPIEIWGLRAKAISQKMSLPELGRIWIHLNQRRGYNHSRHDASDSKQTEYVATVNNRYALIKEGNQTVGQHFYEELKKYFSEVHKIDAAFRIKEKVFPRAAYKEEFDKIWRTQQQYYPQLLTEDLYQKVRNEIIYYQRKLKSQKGLVNVCEFEGVKKRMNNRDILIGPKVAPKSSPLFQVEKIWETINNITIKNNRGEVYVLNDDEKSKIFVHLDNNATMPEKKLFEILGFDKGDGYYTNTYIRTKGIQGNFTKSELIKILKKDHQLLVFELEVDDKVDKSTGEMRPVIKGDFEHQPLYKLWHSLYSLEEQDCIKKLTTDFGLSEDVVQKLLGIDFTKGGFGNKSARAIRKILPYLQQGFTYDKACNVAGYRHSDSLTKEENLKRQLKEKLDLLPKNTLRQPIVEKILNQLINLVNAIIERYGHPQEIRVELARELRQSRDERNATYLNNNKREKRHREIENLLLEHPAFIKKKVSKRDVEKYKLWQEFHECSPYEPRKKISLSELFSGEYEIEHILPKALRFDDSFGNKTICHRRYNSGEHAKNNYTAYDYMQSKRSKEDFSFFLSCIEQAYNDKRISKTKYENLLCKAINIKADFISRQLNETRYIARKAKGVLLDVCHNVYTTSGSITQQLRNIWGWNEILEQLNIGKYQNAGLTEIQEVHHNGQTHQVERIKDWSKRDDHRHHAIDALTIACTQQGFIQRINTLNAAHTRQEMYEFVQAKGTKHKLSLLNNYLLQFKPFDTAYVSEHISAINISFKPGKKVATFSRRLIAKGNNKICAQKHILTPRGPLSEESVYGKVQRKITRNIKLDKNFKSVESIIDPKLKDIVRQRVTDKNGDSVIAFSNLKKDPIWLDKRKEVALTSVDIIDYVSEFVIKYPLESITAKDTEFIIDKAIKEKVAERLKAHSNDHKLAWKDLATNPLWFNEEKKIPIKRIRLYTGLNADSVVPIKVKDTTWDIEYEKYVKPGNNHHIAIYRDGDGKLVEHVVTFWHATERKKYGLAVIIKKPVEVWDQILNEKRELPNAFLEKLPKDGWEYVTSMQQNESFIFGLSNEEVVTALKNKKYKELAPFIFRVRKLTAGNYWFNQQYETKPRESLSEKKAKRCVQASLSSMNGIKIKINILGEITLADAKVEE